VIYVALVPWPAWVGVLAGAWIALFLLARGHVRDPLATALLSVMAVQAVAASSTALATSHDSLDAFPCLMGYFGMWVAAAVTVLETVALLFLFRRWSADPLGGRWAFGAWVLVWFAFNAVALLAHLRSTALCTV
jgi:hypothetical protein